LRILGDQYPVLCLFRVNRPLHFLCKHDFTMAQPLTKLSSHTAQKEWRHLLSLPGKPGRVWFSRRPERSRLTLEHVRETCVFYA
jgi:hypothetical protein